MRALFPDTHAVWFSCVAYVFANFTGWKMADSAGAVLRKLPEPRDEPRRVPFLHENVCLDDADGTVRDRLAPRTVMNCFDLLALAQTAACWQKSRGS